MRLWTIQREEAFREFERRGVLHGDRQRIDADYRAAYEWMAEQMRRRIGGPPPGCTAPVWAWKAWFSSKRAKPDLRHAGHLPRGTVAFRVQIEVPGDQVLLSDFARWVAILNNGWLADNEAEFEAWERNPPADHRESWERVFELERGDPEFWDDFHKRGVQATLWQLEWAQVRDVTKFVAR